MHSSFRDFESYLRIWSLPDENDIQLILKQFNSKFTTYNFLQAFTHLKIFLKFFQEVLKMSSNSEICNQIKNKSDPIQLSSETITLL